MDAIDEHILLLLQENGRLTNQELAAQVGLTPAPCLRRVRKLEEDGVITGYSAIVDRTRMGRGFEVIIHADLVAKDFRTVAAFEERMAGMSEVAELRRMFGIPDYFIRVRVADLVAFEKWLTTQLMGDPAIARVDSRITMKILKTDAP
ncbi:Lrp/AsnC family transcriptional regulator [Rhodococcus sp. 06-156-3C]|uniref:Lrp/AsnC family transcriptional regulator n=1 Tax=Nocardiaceae TaxID=85025 RepID=UPI000522F4FA|nr:MULTISPECIES: Lrp/AsnC family transcriptional regulator [Rhodococcus]OZD12169.1 Lrp/AsnC family transcriptional regulator [Rhodococcus sp. 06-156-3C]OZD19162.1 Lrp/AsnC family transcriptional regulator [Rhodococcus sp. 06-156-4C]OZD20795.1 Lrp/AsnC family transcriptional regulator [Rhodococcus sp. 06-156-4a]OZD28971.1 Lrp/AsnC family transcriptional regulator [Rhodococcus sp. 06-156-3b]OZD33527.1 Lrp/AsnC family transcriptional regulator [Rhodococcus sp. 06-156-3]